MYYLYTGRITFDTDLESPSTKGPKIIDSTVIYAQADRLLLDDLKKIAFDFFKSILVVDNITAYIFDEHLCLHKEIDSYCSEFFAMNIEKIVGSDGYIKFFDELEECSIERRAWVDSRFRQLVQSQVRMLKRKR